MSEVVFGTILGSRQIPKSFRKGNVIFLFFGITTVGRELLEYAVVALLVSLVKIASGHGFADAEVIKFSGCASIATMRSRRLSRFDSCPNIIVSS